MSKFVGIICMDSQRGIGKELELPWPRSEGDLKWFKEKTTGSHVILGGKTYRSLGIPYLKNRHLWVLTKQNYGWTQAFTDKPDGEHSTNILNNVDDLPNLPLCYIAGGLSIYRQFESKIEEWLVTMLKKEYDADIKMFEFEDKFKQKEIIFDDEKMTITRYFEKI